MEYAPHFVAVPFTISFKFIKIDTLRNMKLLEHARNYPRKHCNKSLKKWPKITARGTISHHADQQPKSMMHGSVTAVA